MRITAIVTGLVVLVTSGVVRGQCETYEIQKIIDGWGAADDRAGECVALWEDVAVVGSQYSDFGSWTGAGSAAIYRHDGNSWTLDARLVSGNPDDWLYYGTSVAVHEDVVAVGATGEAGQRGSVSLYRHNGTNWAYEQTVMASDGDSNDLFGWSVALWGDVLLVGAIHDDDDADNAGAGYVFRYDRRAKVWVEERKLRGSGTRADHKFGASVSLRWDLALVGTQYGNAAYVYRYDGSIWGEEQILTGSDSSSDDQFGRSVSVLTDSGGDQAVVGAYDQGDVFEGAVYVFQHDGTRWSQVQKLVDPRGGHAGFGLSVSLARGILAVGAPFGRDGGSVYTYEDRSGSWKPVLRLRASDWADGDYLGQWVAVAQRRVLAGAPLEDYAGKNAGAAYCFAALPDLDLASNLAFADPGDRLTFTTSFGYPGDPVGLAIVKANGVPMFQFVAIGSFRDPSYTWKLSSVVPPGLAGLDAWFQSFGLTMCDRLDGSDRFRVRFR